MKASPIILFFVFFLTFSGAFTAQSVCFGQQWKWYMNHYQVDFSASSPVSNTLPFSLPALSGGPGLANGYHDGAGNLQIYSVWVKQTATTPERYDIYNGNGILVGSLSQPHPFAQEMVIVPFECEGQGLFLIVYHSYVTNTSGNSIQYMIADPVGLTLDGPYTVAFLMFGGPIPMLALSAKNADGTHYLYANTNSAIRKYIVDFSNCSLGLDLIVQEDIANSPVFSSGAIIKTRELELSPAGDKLAYGSWESNIVTVLHLDGSGNLASSATYSMPGGTPFQDNINGLEFNGEGTKLFVAYQSGSAPDGIYPIDLVSGTVNDVIAGTENYGRSHVEMAYDCFLYAGNFFEAVNENRLARINPEIEAFEGSFLMPGPIPGYLDQFFQGVFTLPDFIDYPTNCAQAETCPNNLAVNGHFQDGLIPGDLTGPGNVDYWFPIPSEAGGVGFSTPQVIASDGCAENGAIRMWGNQVVGEGIRQGMTFTAGQTYQLSFCGKFTPTVQPNARLRFRATNNPNLIYNYNGGYLPCNLPDCEEIFLSPILVNDWEAYAAPEWTPQNNYSDLVVTVWNDFAVDDGAFVSWAQVDDICLQAVEQPACNDSILLNGDFLGGWAPGDLNGSGNVDNWFPIPSSSGGAGLCSPQVINQGCADDGAIMMWGNQVVGEGIRQNVTFTAGETYQLSFCAEYLPTVQPNARLRFRATNHPNLIYQQVGGYGPCNLPDCEEIFLSPVLTTGWNTYADTDNWTPQSNYSNLVVTVWNDFAENNGDYVSWARVDNICISIPPSSTQDLRGEIQGGVFPNPTDGKLSIRFLNYQVSKGSLAIMDMWGKTHQTISLPAGISEYDFSVSGLSPGIYLLVVIDQGQPIWREKIVKR